MDPGLELRALAASLTTPAGDDGPALLTLDPQADEVLLGFERDLEPRLAPGSGDLAHLAGWAAKLAGAACRIAALLHLASHLHDGWAQPISADTLAGAIQLADYLINHARAVFDLMGADPRVDDARWLLDWIARTGRTQFSRRDAHQAARGRSAKPPTWSRPWPCWRSTSICVASMPTRPGPRAADPPHRGFSSTLCLTTQNPHNPQNRLVNQVLRVVRVLSCVATPRAAADERHIGCHVIQPERPQPLPAISGSRAQPPAAASTLPMNLYGPASRTPSPSSVRAGLDGLGELAQARAPLPGLLANG